MTLQTTIGADVAPTASEKAFAAATAAGVEHVHLGTPVVADVDRIVNELDPIADGDMSIIAQPDVPRNLTYTVVDANDSSSGTLTVTGYDQAGNLITEVSSWTAAGTVTLDKIFSHVTTVNISSEAGAASGDTLGVGVGNKIGLPKAVATTGAVKMASLGGATVAPGSALKAVVELDDGEGQSSVDLSSSTYDGSKALLVRYQPGL